MRRFLIRLSGFTMRSNMIFFVMVGLLLSWGAPVGRAQDEPPKVLEASEEVQRTFLRKYLLLFAPEAYPALNLGEVEPPPVVFEGMGGKDPYDVGRVLRLSARLGGRYGGRADKGDSARYGQGEICG
jgi:hypothetical protein